MQLNNKKIINAWCMFDWANSVYSLVITATIFPIYYNDVTQTAFQGNMVDFLGMKVENTALYSFAISFSFLLLALLLPLLSGVADYSGKKKTFMRFFTTLGSMACISLFFFTGENIELGILGAVLASIGFGGGLVFYNAYLPEIASPDRYDAVSARGYSLGYAGSVVLMAMIVVMSMNPGLVGLESSKMVARIAFILVGIWWISFSQITFYYLPNREGRSAPLRQMLTSGFAELRKVWQSIKIQVNTRRFLLSFFFYNMGVQTVLLLAASFGDKELGIDSTKLIATILGLQLVAILGAYVFAMLSGRIGNRSTLIVILLVWIVACSYAYFISTENQFFAMAAAFGIVMGGVQSLSRATYSKLLPEETKDTASYFSFYDVLEKLSIVLGTASYGLIVQLTGSMRSTTLALISFFVLGLLFLFFVKVAPARRAL